MKLQLSDEHLAELVEESAISPDLIVQRGCRTVNVKADLERLGFSRSQISVPALVLPWYRPDGSVGLYQMKPKEPRIKDGKPVKYEVPTKSKAILDVHPAMREKLHDPDVPIYITEGIKKGDSLASRGCVAVTLIGVWSWRGTNEAGGKVALPDWELIPLNGRFVHIVFDSDVMVNRKVYAAQKRLKEFLESRGAFVDLIYLPPGENGAKQGVDDFFASGNTLDDLFRYRTDEIRVPPNTQENRASVHKHLEDAPIPDDLVVPDGYEITHNGIYHLLLKDRNGDYDKDVEHIATAPILISKVLENIDGGRVAVELCWLLRGQWIKRVVDREQIASATLVTALAGYGLPANSNNAKALVQYLAQFEATNADQLPIEAISSHLGWVNDRGFVLGRTYIGDGTQILFNGSDEGNDQLADGIVSTGNLDAWREAVMRVLGYPKASLALYASFTAPLLKILGAPSFIVDYAGETTGGKTTCLQLAASVWGNPDLDSDEPTALGTWNSTNVRFERASSTLHNLPLILDETKKARFPSDVAKAVYDFASGHGRGRGSKSGLAASATWKSVLISSGEQPITSFTKDAGQHARVLSVWGSPFGERSEKKAREVNDLIEGIRSNHGYAGDRLMRYVLEHRDEWTEWRKAYEVARKAYAEAAAGNVGAARLAGPLAAIKVASVVAGIALDLPNIDPVKPLFNEFASAAEGADKAREALRAVVSWASSRPTQFFERHKEDPNNSSPIPPTQGWLGRWPKNEEYIAFFKEPLEKFLISEGYSSPDIMRIWRDRGWLLTDKDCSRLTKSHKAKGLCAVFGRQSVPLITVAKKAIEEST
jgi:uncharacterized protein (DUF927 family)